MRCSSSVIRRHLLGASAAAIAAATGGTAQAQSTQALDPITIVATKTEEKAIESLAAVSVRRQEDFDRAAPTRLEEALVGIPSLTFQNRGDDPSTAINLRGLQDFGRVAVVVDGARQNFQKSGHNANGAFYLEPELLSGVDVVRGPVSNIYGSGAIGGVVAFTTKDVNDVLRPGEKWGVLTHVEAGSNQARGLSSAFAAARPNENVDIFAGATYRSNSNYISGSGDPIPGIAATAGPGREIQNTAFDVATGIAKVTVRPAEGHEIKIGGLTYQADFTTGQPPSSTYDTKAQNNLVNARYKYFRPDDNIFNVDANVYWTQTRQDQVKVSGAASSSTGRIGDPRFFDLRTVGFDLNNTSRFTWGDTRHAFTVGVDGFRDEVNVFDPGGANDNFTPSGERNVYGSFAQLKSNYSTWLEVIGALRYDAYDLKGSNGFGSDGDRLSPKITVGVTPIAGITPYFTYAEGYRAPALTETINAGFHPPFFPGGPPGFQFVPNPDLRPEIGKTKEAGINFKFDNVALSGDKIRAKINVFRNDVEDFIDAVQFGPIVFGTPFFFQYQNVAQAQIDGIEFESLYDAGPWFAGVSGHHIRGKNVDTGGRLATIPPDQIAFLAGVRFWDNKMTASARWAIVDEITSVVTPPTAPITYPSYNLVNAYLSYAPTPDVLAGFSVENLLNEYYVRYREVLPTQGVTYKLSLKLRLAAS